MIYIKDFDGWNNEKKELEKRAKSVFFKEGEIRWTSIGVNIGSESCGKGITSRRPVLVLKKLSSTSCIVIPLTTQKKTGTWFVEISLHQQKSRALLYQVRMMSTHRFQRRLGVLDYKNFSKTKEKLKQLLGF